VIVKTLAGSDNYDLYRRRQFAKDFLQEFYGPSSGMDIARAEFPMPEIFGDPIEAEKGVIGGPAPLLRIVSYPSHLLFAIKGKNRRV
jgi:hypothetical protein